MAKVDPFKALGDVPSEPSEAVPQVLQRRASRAKRNRKWEQEHPKVSYRGIPAELNQKLVQLAQEINVPVGELARYFLEYGLLAYQAGDLSLEPRLKVGKMTLFPGENTNGASKLGRSR